MEPATIQQVYEMVQKLSPDEQSALVERLQAHSHAADMIASSSDVRSGQPVVAGTGLRVADVVIAMTFHDRAPDEIAQWYGLTLAQVHAALAYYYDHKDAIDARIRAQIKRAEELKEKGIGGQGSILPG
jgi:uncharacterized protein (DUF433 family)